MDNVKFKLLCRLLGLPRPYVRGLLEVTWDVAHTSGNPVLGSADAVEAAAEWPGERGKFFEAMRDCRLIDLREDGAWEIHDYWHHAPEYVKGRLRKELQRRRETDAAVTVTGQSRDSHGNGPEVRATPSPSPSPLASPNGEACSEPGKPASEPPVADPVVMTFPTVGKGVKEWHLRESKLAEYRDSYPSVDVLAECRKARQWCIDNPRNRKTAPGMPAMLSRWLAKEQNSGRTRSLPLNGDGATSLDRETYLAQQRAEDEEIARRTAPPGKEPTIADALARKRGAGNG